MRQKKLKVQPTSRGFLRAKFKDYNGYECSIQKSSIATKDCLWLGVDEPNAKIFPGDNTGWHDYPIPSNVQCSTRMHLDRNTVKKLLPLLQHFAETGELPL